MKKELAIKIDGKCRSSGTFGEQQVSAKNRNAFSNYPNEKRMEIIGTDCSIDLQRKTKSLVLEVFLL